jgi:hypothetical protein
MKPNSKRIIFASVLLGMILVANFNFATAQNTGLIQCGNHGEPTCTIRDLISTIKRLINFLLSWAWLVAVVFIAWSAWEMINAGGNPQALAKAKTGLSNAIIGFFLVLASFLLLNMIIFFMTGEALDLTSLRTFLP